MGVVACRRVGAQRAATQDVVSGERDQHRMLDVVVEGVAVADAFQRDAGDGRHQFDKPALDDEL